MIRKARFLGIFFLVLISGCGYTTRSMITNKYRTIYIPPFINKVDVTEESAVATKYRIYRPMLESEITRSVVDKYVADGNLRPSDKGTSDLELIGELIEFRRDPLRYNDDDTIAEYRINTVVNITLTDVRENKVLWQESGFTGFYSYFTSGSQAISEDAAVKNAIIDLARRVVERTVEQW